MSLFRREKGKERGKIIRGENEGKKGLVKKKEENTEWRRKADERKIEERGGRMKKKRLFCVESETHFLGMAEKSGESEAFFVPSPAISLSFFLPPPPLPRCSSLWRCSTPAITWDWGRPEKEKGEEARGGERELVSALGAGPTAGTCVCVWCFYVEVCVCT